MPAKFTPPPDWATLGPALVEALAEVLVWYYDSRYDGTHIPSAIRECEDAYTLAVHGHAEPEFVAQVVRQLTDK